MARMPDGWVVFVEADKLEVRIKESRELVLCKHCKHGYYADNRIPAEQHWACERLGRDTDPDGWCYLAEKEG